ncbi:hypothetical protein KGA66_12940 [Actinocrinis puniceicyclus]|uniref:TauD/TfdA-like domain-containing protein n=1 Tax=Actinocrinis puniceicyclus TaxID=977794 RepID=A0A8J8BCW8_9ACTN|nr:TauD/TfdA family dioxygenase [Actinocrinis puniceicyclus]MBS2963955.1 hypothetical protein [Actinocrinis puniceicyclus]
MARAEGIAFRSIGGTAVGLDEVAACLSADGIVVFTRAHRTRLADLLEPWTVARTHPHADGGAVTVIEPHPSASEPGSNGFSRGAVAPHTDRALIRQPPALAAVLVERPATSGGLSLLVDLKADRWFRLLARHRPTQRSLWLHAADGSRWPVIEATGGLMRARFRDDDLARPRHTGVPGRVLLARLRTLSAKPLVLRLGEGEGYMVHNHRVLHGRSAFPGYRRVVRLLADVRPEHPFTWLNDGFVLEGRRG